MLNDDDVTIRSFFLIRFSIHSNGGVFYLQPSKVCAWGPKFAQSNVHTTPKLPRDFLNRNLFDFQWQIGLGQTLCYQFKSPGNSDHRGLIEVSFQSMRSVYSIANSYLFKLPRANLECFCDCPGGANHCNAFTNR